MCLNSAAAPASPVVPATPSSHGNSDGAARAPPAPRGKPKAAVVGTVSPSHTSRGTQFGQGTAPIQEKQ